MLYADKGGNLVSPTSFCLLPSSGHTFFVKLWFSLQEVLTKDEDKKTITCPEQLICFLYLRVSQNTALYRNTERRPQRTSSRTEASSPVWTRRCQRRFFVKCSCMQRIPVFSRSGAFSFSFQNKLFNFKTLGVAAFIKQMKLSFQKIIAKQQINSSSWGTWMRCSGSLLGGQSRQSGSEAGLQPSARLNHNMWPLSQHGWDWLLFTEECLCSTTEQEGKYLSDVKLT